MDQGDSLIIGGGMAYTFLKAQGEQVGKSLVEDDKVDLAKQLLQEAKTRKLKFLLPVDHVAADKIGRQRVISPRSIKASRFPANLMALDIGPKTIELFAEEIARARTILWNGPMGVFEISPVLQGHVQDRTCGRG